MKKCLKFLKNHYLLFSVLTLYIVIPIILIFACYFSAHSLEFVSENIITVISGILAYIGTTVLGLVSVWQNKQAFVVNSRLMHLQKEEFEKNKSSIIRFKQDINFSALDISESFFDDCEKSPQNFYILTNENNDFQKDRAECIELYFDSIGHELNKVKILSLSIESPKKIITKYFPFDKETKTGFCFDFQKQAYKLSLLLFNEKIILQRKAKEISTKIDLILNLCSKANIQSNLHITFYVTSLSQVPKIDSVLYYYYNDEILQKDNKNNLNNF